MSYKQHEDYQHGACHYCQFSNRVVIGDNRRITCDRTYEITRCLSERLSTLLMKGSQINNIFKKLLNPVSVSCRYIN